MIYFNALEPIGVNLSLFPFPITFIYSSLKFILLIFKFINSVTLNPQLYSVSIIALFLWPCFLLKSIDEIINSISSTLKTSGSFKPIFGFSINRVGSSVI